MLNKERIIVLIKYIESMDSSNFYYPWFSDVVECLYCLLNEDFRKYTYQYCYHRYRFADIIINSITREVYI